MVKSNFEKRLEWLDKMYQTLRDTNKVHEVGTYEGCPIKMTFTDKIKLFIESTNHYPHISMLEDTLPEIEKALKRDEKEIYRICKSL